jgi:hypothetical protein
MIPLGRRFLPLPCVAVMLCGAACKIFQNREAMVKIISRQDDARLATRLENEAAIIEIFSASGIGAAVFEFIPGLLPPKILLRFHLRGLEELRFAYGETEVKASIASTSDNAIRQSISRAGEKPMEMLTANSPFWMKLRVASRDQKIPLREGYIEVEAPADFLRSGARQVKIHWIDFYR